MSTPVWLRTPAARTALGALVIAAAVAGWSAIHTLRAAALPDAPATMIASLDAITRRNSRPPTDVQAAVESDLFSPDRTAPAAPYRMPGEPTGNEKTVEAQKPIVLGTVVATDGRSFATVQLGDSRPTLVHVGDKIGEWAVRAIERGKVTFVGAGGIRTEVTAPKPGT